MGLFILVYVCVNGNDDHRYADDDDDENFGK